MGGRACKDLLAAVTSRGYAFETCIAVISEPTSEMLVVLDFAGDRQLAPVTLGDTIRANATSFPHILRQNRTIHSSEEEDSPGGRVVRELGMRSWVAFPLRAESGAVVGMIGFLSSSRFIFDEGAVAALEAIVAPFADELVRAGDQLLMERARESD